jgi:two-component system chemotaxis response regulator CheB
MQPEHGRLRHDNRDIIVIGASAGGLDAIRTLLGALPPDLTAAIFIVIHRGPSEPNLLADILGAASRLPVVTAVEEQIHRHGTVFLAPADRHLLVGRNHVHVRRGPRENRARPAIDPLFRSAAVHCSTRVIAVVLSGMLDDGTAGLLAVKNCGGLAIVQEPSDALYPEMPLSAIQHVTVDHVLPVQGMAELLVELTAVPRPPAVEPPENVRMEAMIPALEIGDTAGKFGVPTPLTCPDCHGTIYEIEEGGLLRYRCHTGHAFTLESMRASQTEAWERALYGGLRAQEEQAHLARRVAASFRQRGDARGASALELRALSYEEGADTLRRLLAVGGNEG